MAAEERSDAPGPCIREVRDLEDSSPATQTSHSPSKSRFRIASQTLGFINEVIVDHTHKNDIQVARSRQPKRIPECENKSKTKLLVLQGLASFKVCRETGKHLETLG